MGPEIYWTSLGLPSNDGDIPVASVASVSIKAMGCPVKDRRWGPKNMGNLPSSSKKNKLTKINLEHFPEKHTVIPGILQFGCQMVALRRVSIQHPLGFGRC